MALEKKLFFIISVLVLILFGSSKANASNEPIQTISGEVSTSGKFDWSKNLEDQSKPEWKTEEHGIGGESYFVYYDNRIEVISNWYGGHYLTVYFDENGNIIDKWEKQDSVYQGIEKVGVCLGDDNYCKVWTWAHLYLKSPKKAICNFGCNQKNKYNYSVSYESKKQDIFSTIVPSTAYKCEEIRANFIPQSEWFGQLDHSCTSQEGGWRIAATLDLTSPPTNVLACGDQTSCLDQSIETQLTPTTWGKGAQKVPTDFINSVTKSLIGSDESIKCANGICIPYASGIKKLSTIIPETTYYGQCRGSAVDETIAGEIVKTPEVSINTEEVKIPGATSTLDLTVKNRPPIATVSFDKSYIEKDETVKVYCDIIDPDDCVDKIVKVKWNCMDSTGATTDCFFLDQNQIFRQGQLFKEITPANPYRDTVDLKLTKEGVYGITCEAWDNDGANALSGSGINSITVSSDPICIADGWCNPKCTNDPDCGVIPEGSCFVTRIKPTLNIKKIKPKTKVTYQAKLFGGASPAKYTWFCDKNETTSTENISTEKTNNKVCDNYILDNHTYEPKAIVTYADGSTKECTNNDGTAISTDGIAPDVQGFCVVVPDGGGSDISACGDKATAKFKVYSNYEFSSPEYVWSNCNGATNSSSVECNYTTSELSQKFTPALTVKDNGDEIKCPSNSSITLYKEAGCNVLSRVKGSGEDYSGTVKATVGETLESKIERKCLDPKETTTWSAANATLQSQDNNTSTALLNIAGNVTVSAKVKVGGGDKACKESSTDVKEKIEIR